LLFNADPAQLLSAAILIGIFLLIAFPVHEFSHAAAAYLLGDGTAKMFGRLTLNPIKHFDPLGGLLLVISVLASGFVFSQRALASAGFFSATSTPTMPYASWPGRWQMYCSDPASSITIVVRRVSPAGTVISVGRAAWTGSVPVRWRS